MNEMLLGFLAAIASMIVWGSYFVPMKRVKVYDPFYFQLLMGIAILLSSFLISLVSGSLTFAMMPVFSGIIWSFGNVLSVLAVPKLGLSLAAPLWMGTAIFFSFLWGTIVFRENLSSIILGIFGVILLTLGI